MKIRAPLLSMGAFGQIGKAFVMAAWRGVIYARQYVTPSNPNSTAQQATRKPFRLFSDFWKYFGPVAQAPWDAFATGKKFTGRNSFIGKNVELNRGEANLNNFLGSPGARGGPAAPQISAATGGAAGEIDVTFVYPTLPTGWSVNRILAYAFPNQAPDALFVGPIVEDAEDQPATEVVLAGLGSGVACQVVGYVEYLRPDGLLAYSVGVTDQATSGA